MVSVASIVRVTRLLLIDDPTTVAAPWGTVVHLAYLASRGDGDSYWGVCCPGSYYSTDRSKVTCKVGRKKAAKMTTALVSRRVADAAPR